MKFSLKSRPLGTLERYVVCAGDCELEILAGFGAGLNGWRVPFKGQKLDLLSGYRDAETFRKVHADTNAGVCLSPFPGRTADAKWNWNGKSYRLENNVSWAPHALHGFLHVLPWKMVDFTVERDRAILSLERDFYGDLPGYPFPYKVTNFYEFAGDSFTVKSVVENTGSGKLPYAEGFHPYFKLGGKIDDWVLKLPPCHRAILDASDIPTGKFERESRFEESRIGDAFINDYFSLDSGSSKRESVWMANPATGARLRVWQEAGKDAFRGIQIYTPPLRDCLAVEPMTAEPDVLNHHRNLIEIDSGKSVELLWGAEF